MFRPMKPTDLAIDVGLAFVCFLVGLAGFATSEGALSVITLTGMACALAIRRLGPGPALVVAWCTAIVQVVSGGYPEPSNLAILAVLFTTAAYGSPTVKWFGFASTFVGAAVVSAHLVVVPALQQYSLGTVLDPGASPLGSLREVLSVFVACLVLFLLSWVLGLLAKVYSSARASRRAQTAAEASHAVAQREMLVEQERTRIARDMHDVVAHSLAVVIAQADGARYARKTDDAAVDGALLTIAATARGALGDVRILLAQLRDDSPAGPQPGLADLETLFEQLRASGLRLVVRSSGSQGALPPGPQLAAYRIVQEALTNALRHGDHSSDVVVELAWTTDALALVVSSALRLRADGTAPSAAAVGHGLAGMRERALLAGGTFSASADDGRFTVRAALPRPRAAAPPEDWPALTAPGTSAAGLARPAAIDAFAPVSAPGGASRVVATRPVLPQDVRSGSTG